MPKYEDLIKQVFKKPEKFDIILEKFDIILVNGIVFYKSKSGWYNKGKTLKLKAKNDSISIIATKKGSKYVD